MNNQNRKEELLQRKAARLVEEARKAEERARTGPIIHLVIGQEEACRRLGTTVVSRSTQFE